MTGRWNMRTVLFLTAGLMAATGLASDNDKSYFGPATMPEHAVTHRKFTGIPSLCVTPKGRLWATWYAGPTPGEDANNYIVLSTSADGGETWKEVVIADPDGKGPSRYFDANLWITPDGRLQWNWAERRPGYGGKWGVKGDLTSVHYKPAALSLQVKQVSAACLNALEGTGK